MTQSTVQSIQNAVQAFGPVFNLEVLEATQNIYRPHILPGRCQRDADVQYGLHPRHRLDLYLPAQAAKGIVVYIHGGGFVRGDKNIDDTFYSNVGQFFADNGYAAILPNYRRAPEFPWPTGARDVNAAVEWVHGNMDRFARCTLPVFVLGQSAGATHVASWLFDDVARSGELGDIAGVLLMSGFYHARAPLPENITAYFGSDPSEYAARSPLSHVHPVSTPIWLSLAEMDPVRNASQTYELAQALTVHNGFSPDFAWLRGHNHISPVFSLGSPQDDAGRQILGFLGRHSG